MLRASRRYFDLYLCLPCVDDLRVFFDCGDHGGLGPGRPEAATAQPER
jgi:hypothetical protein